jgi:hypothetical protein
MVGISFENKLRTVIATLLPQTSDKSVKQTDDELLKLKTVFEKQSAAGNKMWKIVQPTREKKCIYKWFQNRNATLCPVMIFLNNYTQAF